MARTYYVGVALVCTLSLLSLSPLAGTFYVASNIFTASPASLSR